MKIEKDSVVTFHYHLRNSQGEQVETSRDGDAVLALVGHRNMIRGLEQAMIGKQAGDTFSATVEPALAYGERVADSQQRVPVKHLHVAKKTKLKPGMVVAVETEKGPRQVTIVKAGRYSADVDTNHPLAGQTLSFDVEIIDVRVAEKGEVEHGHAHGVGGHQH